MEIYTYDITNSSPMCKTYVRYMRAERREIMERQLGIKHNSIAKAIRNGTRAGGYHWQYVDLEGGEYDS